MGQLCSAPVELVRLQRSGGPAWRGAVAEMQGWRQGHEDAHFMRDGRGAESCVFGVLDGHGGTQAARLSAQRLPPVLAAASADAAVQKAFVATDEWLAEQIGTSPDSSGTTVVCGGLRDDGGGQYSAMVANAGDSRGVFVRRRSSKVEIMASSDHKPDREDEQSRIEAAEGFVTNDGDACARLDGVLAVSRGFGDFCYKRCPDRSPADQKVSCVPELYREQLQAGDFLLLACDGVFDVLSNAEVVGLVLSELEKQGADCLAEVAATVLRECLDKGSKDNMTLMIIEVGVDGSAWAGRPDELLGLAEYDGLEDEAVRANYRAFLEGCREDSALPPAAEAILAEQQLPGAIGPDGHPVGWADRVAERAREKSMQIREELTAAHEVPEEPGTPGGPCSPKLRKPRKGAGRGIAAIHAMRTAKPDTWGEEDGGGKDALLSFLQARATPGDTEESPPERFGDAPPVAGAGYPAEPGTPTPQSPTFAPSSASSALGPGSAPGSPGSPGTPGSPWGGRRRRQKKKEPEASCGARGS